MKIAGTMIKNLCPTTMSRRAIVNDDASLVAASFLGSIAALEEEQERMTPFACLRQKCRQITLLTVANESKSSPEKRLVLVIRRQLRKWFLSLKRLPKGRSKSPCSPRSTKPQKKQISAETAWSQALKRARLAVRGS